MLQRRGITKRRTAKAGKVATLAIAMLATLSLGACVANRPLADKALLGKDIHERISVIGYRHGYHDGIRTQRDAGRGFDTTSLNFPLDGVKTRHYSLENLLKSIGGLIAQPEFAKLPISIEIRASAEADRVFLRDALTQAIAGKDSVDINLRPAPTSSIVIAVARSSPTTH